MKKTIAGILALAILLFPTGAGQKQDFSADTDNCTAMTAHAETSVWNGSADTSWYYREHQVVSQNGEKIAIFNICTAEQLAGLAKLVRNGNTMENTVINLTADIVLNDTGNFENWNTEKPSNNWIAVGAVDENAPINDNGILRGTHNYSKVENFSGTFNGNGHTISGMYSEHHCFAGLFAQVTGVISGVIV